MDRTQPNGASSTLVWEAIELKATQRKDDASTRRPSFRGRSLDSSPPSGECEHTDINGSLPAPAEELQRWNYPRGNMYKTAVSFWGFAVMGLNDATYGAIVPYLQPFYDLQYAIVSLIFLSPFAGYVLSALINNAVHHKFGQRGVAFIGPLCHVIAYVIIAVHPPYPVLVLAFILAGFGNGLLDAGWNAWIGAMANANETLGLLHAAYGVGATIAPTIATAMITKAGLPWYQWYYCMVAFAIVEWLSSVHAFRKETGAKFREETARTTDDKGSTLADAIMKMPAARVSWLCAIFLLGYVGAEVSLGGWIVEFMLRVRDAAEFASGMSATGFWLGMTVGRVVLGFVTPHLGETRAIMVSAVCDVLSRLGSRNGADAHRSTSPSRSASSSCSGWCLNSTSPQLPSLCKASSLDPSSLRPS